MGTTAGTSELEVERAYAAMLRIRVFELAQADLWRAGSVPGELHTSIGEEAIAVGVVGNLRDGDAMAIDHRSTGPLVARGADLEQLLLEVMGDPRGPAGGRAGHMHLMVPELLAAADGIVGSSGPLAVGLALAASRRRAGSVAVAFFGEGAVNQGALLESWNLAAAWHLPVLFVCKDNGWSITTRTRQVTAGDPATRARGFGLRTARVAGWRVEDVHRAASRLLARARDGGGPGFLHARCHRPDGHFMGDPLLRILHEPVEQARELAGPLARAATAPGGSLDDRGRGVATLAARLSRLALERSTLRRDPIRHTRRGLDPTTAARLESDARAEVLDVLEGLDARRPAREVVT